MNSWPTRARSLTTKGGSLVEVAHALVLFRDGHCLEVMNIASGLEVATDQEEIYFVLLLGFQPLNVTVDCVKLPVAAAFHGNLACNRSVTTLIVCGILNSRLSNLHLPSRFDGSRQSTEPRPMGKFSGLSAAFAVADAEPKRSLSTGPLTFRTHLIQSADHTGMARAPPHHPPALHNRIFFCRPEKHAIEHPSRSFFPSLRCMAS